MASNPTGTELRNLRRAQDQSQYALAKSVGCSESTIRNLESGRTEIQRILKPYRDRLYLLFPQLKNLRQG